MPVIHVPLLMDVKHSERVLHHTLPAAPRLPALLCWSRIFVGVQRSGVGRRARATPDTPPIAWAQRVEPGRNIGLCSFSSGFTFMFSPCSSTEQPLRSVFRKYFSSLPNSMSTTTLWNHFEASWLNESVVSYYISTFYKAQSTQNVVYWDPVVARSLSSHIEPSLRGTTMPRTYLDTLRHCQEG